MTAAHLDILQPGAAIPRHGHAAPYAAVVLSGGYEEAGDGGRFRAKAGDVLVHTAFSTHLDRAPDCRTTVLNLPLPWLWAVGSGRMRLDDPDAVARLFQRDPSAAAGMLLATLRPGDEGLADEADAMARVLSGAEPPAVAAWAETAGISRETGWRRFRSAYGVAPARYRLEARARRAWRRLAGGGESLSEIALAEGFADQAHMTRDLRALTGRTPGHWRAMQHSFKTADD